MDKRAFVSNPSCFRLSRYRRMVSLLFIEYAFDIRAAFNFRFQVLNSFLSSVPFIFTDFVPSGSEPLAAVGVYFFCAPFFYFPAQTTSTY